MANFRLIGSSYEQGLRTPNYVNGRLLTAEDLQADHEAMLTRLRSLGQAVGPGVVSGLMVSAVANSSSQLQVTPGLGVNAEGQVIELGGSGVTLAVNFTADSLTNENGGIFRRCQPNGSGDTGNVDAGAFLLTVVPVSRLEGSVAVQPAISRSDTAVCAQKWMVDGLEFKAIPLTGFSGANIPGDQRRNALAYWLFGTLDLHTYMMGGTPEAGLDGLDAQALTPCDLPLAVFYRDDGVITFVDNWSARRRVAASYPDGSLGRLVSDERRALGEARFLQFQDQLNRVMIDNAANLPGVAASRYFRDLPPFGVLPVRLPQDLMPHVGNVIRPYVRQMAEEVRPTGFGFGTPPGFVDLSPAIVNEIAQLVMSVILPRITSRLSLYGFDVYTFFAGWIINDVLRADAAYSENAMHHAIYHPAVRTQPPDSGFNIVFPQQWLDALILAAFIYSADTEDFPSMQINIAGAPDAMILSQELRRVYLFRGRPLMLSALGSQAGMLLAKMQQTNTPLLYAAFERYMPPPVGRDQG